MANYDLTYEGSRVQGILDTGNSLKDAGYIFRGEATPSTVPGTPTERVAYIGGPGTYTNFGGSITVGAGCICVFKYTGSAWSNQVINTGLVYAGVATPSTSPVTGKVFYLAVQAGTYTNFGNAVVTAGLNVIKYNGSAWSVDQLIAIDAEPTQGSANLVKSGGVLNSIIQNGSAFDLSAYNAQGGVLATYADLSAALTALNALPADFKKGGMSMKYVQTSDNKYVQARCMAQNFTTDVTKWQGVDEVPVANSKNLIESGGVQKRLLLNSFIGKDSTYSDTLIYGLIPNHKYIVYLEKTSGWQYEATISGSYIFSINSLLNGNQTILGGTQGGTSQLPESYTFTTPAEFDYIRIGGRANAGVEVRFVVADITEIDKLNTRLECFIIPNSCINQSGELVNSTNTFVSNKIPVNDRDDIVWTYSDSQDISMFLQCFGENFEKIGAAYYSRNGIDGSRAFKLTAFTNVHYIQATFKADTSNYIPLISVNGVVKWNLDLVKKNPLYVKSLNIDSEINGLGTRITSLSESIDESIGKLNKKQLLNSFIGKGSTYSDCLIYGLIPNHKYIVYLEKTSGWQYEAASGYIFSINSLLNGVQKIIDGTTGGTSQLPESYTFTTPAEFDYIRIGGRAIAGVEVKFSIVDITNIKMTNVNDGVAVVGSPINLYEQRFQIKEYANIDWLVSHQSMAIWGNYLFIVNISASEMYVVDANNYNLLQTLSIGYGSYSHPHANSLCFGNEYANGNTDFPLLYMSQWNDDRGVLVYNVSKDSNDVFSLTLVQGITPDANMPQAKFGAGYTDWLVDTDNNKLYSVAYYLPNDDSTIVGNKTVIAKFDLPRLSDGADIILSENDIEDYFDIEVITWSQDKKYYNGKLYILSGGGNSTEARKNKLRVVTPNLRKMVSKLNLETVVAGEPEGLIIKDNTLIFGIESSKKLMKIEFL